MQKKPISPAEFKKQMEKIQSDYSYDTEACHGKMDDLVASVLCSLGYSEGIAVFDESEKWY